MPDGPPYYFLPSFNDPLCLTCFEVSVREMWGTGEFGKSTLKMIKEKEALDWGKVLSSFEEATKDMPTYDIELIKRNGQIEALKKHIDNLIWRLKQGTFDNITNGNTYTRLWEAIVQAEALLSDIQEAFDALQELDPGHK